jgi:hypothetical protein
MDVVWIEILPFLATTVPAAGEPFPMVGDVRDSPLPVLPPLAPLALLLEFGLLLPAPFALLLLDAPGLLLDVPVVPFEPEPMEL